MESKEEMNSEINLVDTEVNSVIESDTEIPTSIDEEESIEVLEVPEDDAVILENPQDDANVISEVVKESDPVAVDIVPVVVEETEDIIYAESGEEEISVSVSEPESTQDRIQALYAEWEHLNSETFRTEKTLENNHVNARKDTIKHLFDLADNLERALSSGKATDVTPMTLRESLEIIADTVTDAIEYDFADTEDIAYPELIKPFFPVDLPEDSAAQIELYTDLIDKLRQYLDEITTAYPTFIAHDKYLIKETLGKIHAVIVEYYETLNPEAMPDVDSMIESIGHIYTVLLEEFETKYQLKHMESTVGSLFNPRLHNGYGVIPGDDESKNNTIVEEISSGYLMGDLVYRKPMVLVYKLRSKEVKQE